MLVCLLRMAGDPSRPANEEQPTEESQRRSLLLQIARYSQLAFVLPAATFIGWLLGHLLDKWLGTSFLYLVGLLIGIAAGFIELVRTVTRTE